MTGWLAVAGVMIVVLASAYSGLTSNGTPQSIADRLHLTPVTDADSSLDAEAEEALPTATPEPPPLAATPGSPTNRANCDQIRGTQYVSQEERTWYLANCVRN